MATAPSVEELLNRNKAYAQVHTPLPFISERASWGVAPPKTFIVTCMDARVIPEVFLKLEYGEAIVHRNAGGHIRKALPDLLALDSVINFDNLFIIHHTDCGLTHNQDEEIRQVLLSRAPELEREIQAMQFGWIDDLEQTNKDDVEFVRQNPLIRKELRGNTLGLLFDVKSGQLTRIA